MEQLEAGPPVSRMQREIDFLHARLDREKSRATRLFEALCDEMALNERLNIYQRALDRSFRHRLERLEGYCAMMEHGELEGIEEASGLRGSAKRYRQLRARLKRKAAERKRRAEREVEELERNQGGEPDGEEEDEDPEDGAAEPMEESGGEEDEVADGLMDGGRSESERPADDPQEDESEDDEEWLGIS